MDFNRLGIDRLNVEFKDMKAGTNIQRTFAEVILIDRTNSNGSQMCYILKNDHVFNTDDLKDLKQNFNHYNKNDFLLIGEVISVNKKQKFVTLKDQNSISYNHLIIATGSHFALIYEFMAGVNTLVDAIRVRKKFPSAFPDALKSALNKKKIKSSKTNRNDLNFPKKIENVKAKKMVKLEKDSPTSINDSHKRLYEVQI